MRLRACGTRDVLQDDGLCRARLPMVNPEGRLALGLRDRVATADVPVQRDASGGFRLHRERGSGNGEVLVLVGCAG